MALETATYISQLVNTNPAIADPTGQGDDHLRLIKACLLATFPNFTAAALSSTQAQIDAAVAAVGGTGSVVLGDGTAAAPSLTFAGSATTGLYRSAADAVSVSVVGTLLATFAAAGFTLASGNVTLTTGNVNLVAGNLQLNGVNVFPLQAANIGALQVGTAALAAAGVTYAKIQNVGADKLLGNPTGAPAAPSEIGIGAGIGFNGTNLVALGAPIGSVSGDLLIVNDGTVPNTKVNITANEAVVTDLAGNSKYFSAVSVSIDTTTTGVNAMGANTGARAPSTEYYWWLISDGTNIKGLGSKQKTLATLNSAGDMPGGYTMAKLVGANFTDGSSNLYRVRTIGRESYFTGTTGLRQIQTGTPGGYSATNPTWTALAWAGLIPAIALKGIFNCATGSSIAAEFAHNNSYTGPSGAMPCPVFINPFASEITKFELILESGNIYIATNGGVSTYVLGWVLPI